MALHTAPSKRYNKLASTIRKDYLLRAEEAAELTLPFIMPREHHSKGGVLPVSYQSLGGRLVNTLASKLLLSQFPPNSPFFKYQIDDFTLEKLDQVRGLVEVALSQMERAVTQEMEAQSMRVPLYETIRHLIITGNALLYVTDQTKLRVFHLDQYVLIRDPQGKVLEMIVCEEISKEVYKDRFGTLPTQSKQHEKDDTLKVYTVIKLDGDTYLVDQYVNDKKIAGTSGTHPLDKSPWIPLRFNAIDGEDYGRGLVEENIGDLRAFEGLSRNILQASAASSKIIFLVAPGGPSPKKLAETENLGFITGQIDDVQALQINKNADLTIAANTAQAIEVRLSASFLLNQSVQRQAERVTAEEIRFLAQELESSLGGIYSLLSHELQLPLVRVMTLRLEQQKKLPVLPKGTVSPVIVTGFEALGRSNDSQKMLTLAQAISQVFGPEATATVFKLAEFTNRVGAGLAIDMKGLLKTEEELKQEAIEQRRVAAQQAIVEKGTGPAIQAGGKLIEQRNEQQGQSNQQQGGR